MNFKQRNLYVLLDGTTGEYLLKHFAFAYLIQKHVQCYFFYILCMEAHAYGLYKI